MSAPRLRFCVRGKVRSNNRNWGFAGGQRPFKDKEAAQYQEKVWSTCYRAAAEQRWVKPSLCAVTLVCWNVKLDVDNTPKCIMDGMKGIAFVDDSPRYVRALFIVFNDDPYDERVEVEVQPLGVRQDPLELPL